MNPQDLEESDDASKILAHLQGMAAHAAFHFEAAEVLAERLREALPEGFHVDCIGGAVVIQGPRGFSSFGVPGFLLDCLGLPVDNRLELVCLMVFSQAADLVSRTSKLFREFRDWPGIGQELSARVRAGEVHVWFGDTANEDAAVLHVRPIPREHFGPMPPGPW